MVSITSGIIGEVSSKSIHILERDPDTNFEWLNPSKVRNSLEPSQEF